MKKLVRSTFCLVLLATALDALAATPADFYRSLLRRGAADVEAGRTSEALTPLRIAAFGLVDSIAEYETALVYLMVAHDRLKQQDRVRDAAQRILAAERIERRFASLTLPPAIRSAFETAARKVLTATEVAALTAPPPAPRTATGEASGRPVVESPSRPVVESPSRPTESSSRPVVESPSRTPATPTPAPSTTNPSTTRRPEDSTTRPAPTTPAPSATNPSTTPRPDDPTTRPAPATTPAPTTTNPSTTPRPDDPTTRPAPATTPAPTTTNPSTTRRPEDSTTRPAPPSTTRRPEDSPTRPTPARPRPAVDVPSRLAAGERALIGANLVEARRIYRELLDVPELDHESAIRVAEGLYRSRDFAGTLAGFQRAGTLRRGEEPYRYYIAVALYETGQLSRARQELAAALPYIELTPDVQRYRAKIEAAR